MLKIRDVVTTGDGGESVVEHGIGFSGEWIAACLGLLEREKELKHG
jgi:hypothetical protein